MSAPEFDLATLRSPSRAAGNVGAFVGLRGLRFQFAELRKKNFSSLLVAEIWWRTEGYSANVVVMKLLLESGTFSISLKWFFGRRAEAAAAAAMGIQGLLPALKSIMTPGHIRDYAGKRAAVDTYCWLHKAAYTCCKDICEGRPNDK